MAQATSDNIIKVIEKQEVTYKKHSFLFFDWYTKLKVDTMGYDIIMQMNEPFDDVFINGEKYEPITNTTN
jgi:hypothetical protein